MIKETIQKKLQGLRKDDWKNYQPYTCNLLAVSTILNDLFPDLSKFLEQRKLKSRYQRNVVSYIKKQNKDIYWWYDRLSTASTSAMYVDLSFIWRSTDEGQDVWKNINQSWIAYCNGK